MSATPTRRFRERSPCPASVHGDTGVTLTTAERRADGEASTSRCGGVCVRTSS
jgi:hypothetical protein